MIRLEPLLTVSELQEFLDQHQLTLLVKEMWTEPPDSSRRWQVRLLNASPAVGDVKYCSWPDGGNTYDEALEGYAGWLTGKRVITDDGREIDVPQPVRNL